eukprot:10456905-Alexandrium_andersonii.AAC.1
MSASLVGSEMCIRDRTRPRAREAPRALGKATMASPLGRPSARTNRWRDCLLYTSDAADDM